MKMLIMALDVDHLTDTEHHTLEEFLDMFRQMKSLEPEPRTFIDDIIDHRAPDPFDEASYSLLCDRVMACIKDLPDRERNVICLRFGLNDGYCRTLEDIAREFRKTRARIHEIEAKAFRRMREREHEHEPS